MQAATDRTNRQPSGRARLAILPMLLSAACMSQDKAPAAADAATAATSAVAAGRPSAPDLDIKPGIPLDLSYVDVKSPQFRRFRSWVDAAVAGSPGYAFAPADAALLFRLTEQKKYCDLAVRLVEEEVASAEAAIARGASPAVAGDSYLEVGPRISDLALTLDTCRAQLTASQVSRWSAYAEQAVWNVWHHVRASWGGLPRPWTGWATDNPGNNYYYSFVEATMYWGLASGSREWLQFLRDEKLPPLQKYFAALPGGGSREGTGYGAAHLRLFALYRLWRDATGQDLANASRHADDSIAYWVHATVPTLDRFAPIGDQSRNSVPELYDYHRRVVLEARQLSKNDASRAAAGWWLHHISVPAMSGGFNTFHDLLPAGSPGSAPASLVHHATGVGHLFARTGWDADAMWLAVVGGPYDESHAHQEQGGFTLFAGDWLAVTENIWTHSGIQQGTETNNVVRFERPDPAARQCQAPANDVVVHQCAPTTSSMQVAESPEGRLDLDLDLTPAYAGSRAVRSWRRSFRFGERKLLVSDRFDLGTGTRAIFQLNMPAEPVIRGQEATAGRLRVRVLQPAGATLAVHDWRSVDRAEFRRGWRLDVSGSDTGYVVELSER